MRKTISIINPIIIFKEIRNLSFYEAVLKPCPAYLKTDNNYWSESNKIALKYRLVFLFCLLLIANSFYLLSNKLTFTQEIRKNYKELFIGGEELSKDFPLRIYSYLNFWYSFKDDLKKSEIENAFLKSSFKPNVASLIRRDLNIGSAELGGIIFYKNNELKFVTLESAFLPMATDIKNSLQNNELLLSKFVKYKSEIEKRFGDDMAIKGFNRWFKREPGNMIAIKKYLQHSVFLSNYSYFLDIDSVMKQFYGLSQGEYIGNFHIHRYGDPVSQVDLDGSLVEDKFVIISQSNKKFQIVWLRKGKIFYTSEQFVY